ncbi:MAG: 1-deoxy-D-xylulose-5-phosphate synthase [Opitutaceae bacterium]|nr:1-deoxy-D-xylulose-5-phosphate synthase [Opitutaceae bacterium]
MSASSSVPPQSPPPSSPTHLLDLIRGPDDVKALAAEQLPQLARELREEIIAVTARNGGHVGPNLGVVELTIALHRVFRTPEDQLVFDVSHQGYVHKLLTGRGGSLFQKLRRSGGTSGFLCRAESPHDSYGAGHAGTALSAALGMATARDLRGTNEHVVAICGDASFTCGITMEALNNIVSSTKRLIVILNDNEWSIAKNVGAIAHYLNRLTTSPTYNKIHRDLETFLKKFSHGEDLNRLYAKWKRETKDFFVESSLFEKYGLRYIGPIDGHNFAELTKNLEFARQSDVPVLVHVLTKKGRGLEAALQSPEKFHGLSSFDPATGESLQLAPGTPPNYQEVFGQALVRFAKANPKIIGITAAMPSGTSLSLLARELPRQFFDVGIAEEHAVLFAAGLATKDFRPVCAIYSTFLQRAYDPIIHDVCLQNLPVTFCLDRAGLSPNDGPTHHGLFDLAFLRCVPNAIVMQPKDEDELVDMLHTSLQLRAPAFIRYPRGTGTGATVKPQPATLVAGQAELLRQGAHIMIWALGPMVAEALTVAERIAGEEGLSVGVVNARFIKPLDRTLLLSQAAGLPLLVTMEDHVVTGGFGSAVLEALQEADCQTPVERIGWPDQFVEHGSNAEALRTSYGLSTNEIVRRIKDRHRRLCPRVSTVATTVQ